MSSRIPSIWSLVRRPRLSRAGVALLDSGKLGGIHSLEDRVDGVAYVVEVVTVGVVTDGCVQDSVGSWVQGRN